MGEGVVGVSNAPSAGLRVSGGSGGLRGQLEAEKRLEENRREQTLRGGGEEAEAMTHCVADGLRPTHTDTRLNRRNALKIIRRSSVVYLVDEAAHPQAGGEHEQRVREEDEGPFTRHLSRSLSRRQYLAVLRVDGGVGHVQNGPESSDLLGNQPELPLTEPSHQPPSSCRLTLTTSPLENESSSSLVCWKVKRALKSAWPPPPPPPSDMSWRGGEDDGDGAHYRVCADPVQMFISR
ncbi:hypothetical protein EYF80_037170 [Liparis tanakae]|uniref:Uncharacterized protein n=1 Tax=Liparis tanakae TaxID=230148 RepID=A0A4Z2GIP7_9TELE|nr:hypothetical protein EYF80_037170 [Liparis tanakae]